ncbi:Uncharacterized protein dnm_084520 [Desulfonema magnum]|uniref:Uncharacterized protein n=1 Tax=Desulfonema magnum TaxID=45655 RepID=A0A975BW49_9BACT|nr:Uncharacterized protein dnm_084520 [Desulfonema magnum]
MGKLFNSYNSNTAYPLRFDCAIHSHFFLNPAPTHKNPHKGHIISFLKYCNGKCMEFLELKL